MWCSARHPCQAGAGLDRSMATGGLEQQLVCRYSSRYNIVVSACRCVGCMRSGLPAAATLSTHHSMLLCETQYGGLQMCIAGAAPVSFQALYNSPSILGAMQFCRYFTSAAGLAVLHMAVNAYQLPPPRHQQAKMHHKQQQDHGEPQRQLQRPFTLVVDVKGTGHVTSLQAALDMAATAAAQGAQQHYCGSVQEADAPQKVAGYGSSRSTEPSRDAEQANDDDCSSSDIASENMLIVLLPGTYPGNYTLPCTIKHITVAGAPGPKALLCQPSSEPDSSSQYHQQLLQSLDARVQQLRLREQQNAPLMRAVSDTARQKQQQTLGGCLLACPFGVTYVKLQNLHMQMAGAAAGSGAAQFQTMLLRQDSAPASFGRGSDSNKSSGCGDGGSSEPYCIRLSAGCELRLEWCEFSGGAGAVSCEPGAMVTAMQCNFHQ